MPPCSLLKKPMLMQLQMSRDFRDGLLAELFGCQSCLEVQVMARFCKGKHRRICQGHDGSALEEAAVAGFVVLCVTSRFVLNISLQVIACQILVGC